MLSFRHACRRPAHANVTFANMPTCSLAGENRGALHNELQFLAGRAANRVNAALEAALIAVGTITVATPELANVSSARVCRARWLAAALRDRFGLANLEVWRFVIDNSLTPEAPRQYVAPRQCSKAPQCVKGGSQCSPNDFGIFARNTSLMATTRDRGRHNHPHAYKPTQTRLVHSAPHVSRALNWGYYYEGSAWRQWQQFET